MFAWTRTWYSEKDGVYYNFDMKRQRDEAVRLYGHRLVFATEAYNHYPQMKQVPWRNYSDFVKLWQ